MPAPPLTASCPGLLGGHTARGCGALKPSRTPGYCLHLELGANEAEATAGPMLEVAGQAQGLGSGSGSGGGQGQGQGWAKANSSLGAETTPISPWASGQGLLRLTAVPASSAGAGNTWEGEGSWCSPASPGVPGSEDLGHADPLTTVSAPGSANLGLCTWRDEKHPIYKVSSPLHLNGVKSILNLRPNLSFSHACPLGGSSCLGDQC